MPTPPPPSHQTIPPSAAQTTDDHDSPWKDALELYFPQALALLAPDLYAMIDWTVPVEFLDKELQAIQRVAGAAGGRRLVDKLAKVQLLTGSPALLLIHVEVQGRLSGPTAFQAFSWRILQYKVLIQTREMRRLLKTGSPPVVFSLGILIDQPVLQAGAVPGFPLTQLSYQDKFLSQKTEFTFPVVELNQWRSRWDELDALAPSNPFAVILMAQIQASGHPDKNTRLRPLVDLVRRLYGYGYNRTQIGQLLRLVEWMIHLPPELEADYLLAADQLEQEHNMSYVTIAERVYTQRALEQGREGQARILLGQLQRRFDSVPDEIAARVLGADVQQLETWSLDLMDAKTLDEVFLGR